MESFFSSLEQELTHHDDFKDREEARSKLFYNRERLHSALGYRSLEDFATSAVSN